ncbi:MAG: response regulator [Spirochaetota bacterium]
MSSTILLVEDLRSIRQAICRLLGKTYEVIDVESAEEAEQILISGKKIDLLITDIRLPGKPGTQLIQFCKHHFGSLPFALFTAYDVNQYIHYAFQENVFNILPKYSFLDISFIKVMADKILKKDIFGVEKYLNGLRIKNSGNGSQSNTFLEPQEGQVIYSKISSDDDRVELCDRIGNFLIKKGAPTAINQILEELSSNAMIRAPRDTNGNAKYQYEFPSKDIVIPLKNIRLEQEDAFEIGYGYTGDVFIIVTRDRFGSLRKEEILKRFDRHIHLDEKTGLPLGLADSHGRGLFICREISDSLIFNIEKGRKTEIICFLRRNGSRFHKSLSIYEI